MPKISVIVPVYNVEKYLARCLKNIINQTLTDIEIICINDGSTDRSLEILKEFVQKEPRIKLIDQPNAGLSCARNAGMKVAQGEYIGFVDSDDWIDTDFYEKLYAAAKKRDADIACGCIKTWRKFNRKDIMLEYKAEEVTENIYRKFYLCDIPETCNVWNRIYRAGKLKENHIEFEHGVMYEVVCFTMEVLYYLKKLVVVSGTYYNYERANENSIVKIKSEKAKQDFEHVQKRMMEFLKSKNLDLPAYYHAVKKYKFSGITVLKIRYHSTRRECKLFNIIKFDLPPA